MSKLGTLHSYDYERVLSHFPNVAFNVVVIAASAGGQKALSEILSVLPEDFPAAITVVQHLSPHRPSLLAKVLNRRTALRVKQAEFGEILRPATVYIAAPNHHLLVEENGRLSLWQGAKVTFARPSANVLFQSVATSYKGRAIAVVLTGLGSDGAIGVTQIKKHGGTTIAQDKTTADFFGMPKAAIETGKVDFVLPLSAIASTLINLLMTAKVVA